jgi:hypothetical protein
VTSSPSAAHRSSPTDLAAPGERALHTIAIILHALTRSRAHRPARRGGRGRG